MTEHIVTLAFTPPSQELLDMLAWLEEAHLAIMRVAEFESRHERVLRETFLDPWEVDRLLTRGCL